MKIIHSVAFFRSDASAYESERCGVARGIFFDNYVRTLIPAHRIVWGKDAELWVHHDERVRSLPQWEHLLAAQDGGYVKLVPCGEAVTLTGSMLWRLRPIYAEGVDWVICRDLDSLPMHRDRLMVEEAIKAGAACHVVHDSESHSGMMGGTSSFHAETFRSIVPKLPSFEEPEFNRHGADQLYLNSVVLPKLMNKTFIHQRRSDVPYPQAMQTKRVLPQVTDLDKASNHLGGCFDVERALAVMGLK